MQPLDIALAFLVLAFFVLPRYVPEIPFEISLRQQKHRIYWNRPLFVVALVVYLFFLNLRISGASPSFDVVLRACDQALGWFLLSIPAVALLIIFVWVWDVLIAGFVRKDPATNKGIAIILFWVALVLLVILARSGPAQSFSNFWRGVVFGSRYADELLTTALANYSTVFKTQVAGLFSMVISLAVTIGQLIGGIAALYALLEKVPVRISLRPQ